VTEWVVWNDSGQVPCGVFKNRDLAVIQAQIEDARAVNTGGVRAARHTVRLWSWGTLAFPRAR